ncbi:putative Kinase [Zostera marina]|uniref:non-specific serine/threonine protein kinase n=1 Tax=Zostera marina TaxID=29655 RepID=A0A0K9NMJ0_ZOSMR|nr:putative Kinase [Zostera marina]
MSDTVVTSLCLFFFFVSTVFAQQEAFVYDGFRRTVNTTSSSTLINADTATDKIDLNGISQIQQNGIIRLTNDTRRLIGRAFYPSPLRFKNSTDGRAFSFSTSFVFAIVPEYQKLGGHGLAFTIANSPDLPGGLPSQYLGLLNASDVGNFSNHLFFVEFDTVQDFEFHDINDNHVGINVNNMRSNASEDAAYYDDRNVRQHINLKSGKRIVVWIDYDGLGKLLNVTISTSSSKPSRPLISFGLDLTQILHEVMYVGISSSTGLLASSHYLFGWTFKMNGEVESLRLSTLPSLPVHEKKNLAVIIGAPATALIVILAAIILTGYVWYRVKMADVIEPWERQYGPHRYSYKELRKATSGFSDNDLLGFGGFGKVYKGTLPKTKVKVAVKRIARNSRQGLREFVAEIASIGRLRHRNLVQLQGWCRRREDLLLVYDYMENGSLDTFLFDQTDLSVGGKKPLLPWWQRFHILRGVASALFYLHEEWEHVVIHRDVKASNVLLDSEMNGKLGDFGLAKLYEHGANPSTTRVVGTLGYLAPETTRSGKATTISDVFSFGALMLEVVCGRRPIEPKAPPEELILVDWVWEKYATEKWEEAVDPKLAGIYEKEEVETTLKVGLMCSHPSPAFRPTMSEVIRYLNGEATIPESIRAPELYRAKPEEGFDAYAHSLTSSAFNKMVTYNSMTEVNSMSRSQDSPIVSLY